MIVLEADSLTVPGDVALPRSPAVLKIDVDIQLVLRTLLCIAIVLIITGTAANFVTFNVAPSQQHYLARVMRRFDLGFEPSLPNWFSAGALFASSALLCLITRIKWRAGDRFRRHWAILALGFFAMSLDEGVRFHEMMNTVLVMMGLKGTGIMFFPWIVVALSIVAVVALSYIPFLLQLDRRTRMLFVWSGAIYVIGAVGIDAIGAAVVEYYGVESIYHTITLAIEETLELVGAVLFIYTLLDYLQRKVGSVQICLRSRKTT